MADQQRGAQDPNAANHTGKFEQDVRNAAARVEDELQRLIRYLNDEVVPDVRKQSSSALRSAADGLRTLAEKMDDRRP